GATPPLGHRRNHAKGICFTGIFESNGAGAALSQARVFSRGEYPVLGRFNLGTPNPNAADATVRVRGIGLRISTPDGQKEGNAMKAFAAAHPEFAAFAAWAGSAPWTGSYAEERYNSLNSFIFVDGSGAEHAVRWSILPAAQPVSIAKDELAKRGPDYLEQEITERVRSAGPWW